jgi:hypothetical protein
MADTKLADLTALTTPSGDDILYIVDDPAGTPLDRKIALDNLFTRGTITADAPVLNMSQTWNNAAVTFTGLKFNATDLASASGSLLLDIGTGGGTYVSKFRVSKAGGITTPQLSNTADQSSIAGTILETDGNGPKIRANGSGYSIANNSGVFLYSDSISTGANTTRIGLGASPTSPDVLLTRRAAANLRLGAADAAAPVAQTLSVQSGTAGASATTVSISGTALTIAGTVTGTIAIGHAVTGTGVSAGTLITAGSGTSWTVNNSQTVGPITMYFNSVGRDLTITGSQASGPSAGGSIIFQVAPAGAAATTAQNALATALTINSAKQVIFDGIATGVNIFDGAIQFSTAGYGSVLFGSYAASIFTGHVAIGGGSGGGPPSGINLRSTGFLAWSSTTSVLAAPDLILARDGAANTLALRNGNNGQTFRLYGRFTDITNDFERFFIEAPTTSGTTVLLGTQKGATAGAARALAFQTDGTTRLTIAAAGSVTIAGSLQVSNTGLSLSAVGGNGFFTVGGGYIIFKSSGVLTLSDGSDTDFGRLQFGGTSASFPALKRVSANLQVIAADGTSSAGLIVGNQALATAATDGFLYVPTCAGTPTGTPTTQTGTAPIVINTTNNKLYFYSDGAWRDAGP